jgi:hypothetical protein
MSAFRAGDFRVTQHAVIRYCQRVKPCLTVVDARRELRQIIPFGELRPRPEWASNLEEREQFLFIGDGIAFPVEDGHLLTCVVKGSLSPEARLRRAEKRKRRKFARAMQGRYGSRDGRREVAA